MPALRNSDTDSWLELSEAAHFLGVHFTTLRRWADAGQVPCIRTPGGRRRFALSDLQQFLDGLRQKQANQIATHALVPIEARTLDVARRQLSEAAPAAHANW